MIVLGGIELAATAAILALGVGLRSFLAVLLAAYLFAVGELVLLLEALSPGRWVTERNLLVAEGLVLSVAVIVWFWRGRPVLRLPVLAVGGLVRESPLIGLLAVAVGVALIYELALAVGTPPNNWDSMTYHMSRAAAWLHHRGIAYVPAHTPRENAFQPNAEVLVLWTFVLDHGDRFAAIWQWLAGPASMAAIFLLTRRAGYGRAEALFAALLFACLTEVALQAVTTQNDLIAASLVIATASFLVRKERAAPWLAALAYGLALGVKLTAAFAFPGIVLVALAVWGRGALRRFAIPFVVLPALFASYGYALNLYESGSILGPAAATGALIQNSVLGAFKTFGGELAHIAFDLRFAPASRPNEDFSYFGLLGPVLLIPAWVIAAVRWRKGRSSRLEHAVVLAVPLYLVALACAYRFNPFVGRFTLGAAALGAPLYARVLHHWRYATAVTAVALVTLGSSVLLDQAKPSGLGGGRSIWTMSRVEAQSVQRPAELPVLRWLQNCVPAHTRIGWVLGGEDWDYPLYGPHFDRTLVALGRSGTLAQAAREGVGYALVRRRYVDVHISGWTGANFPGIGLTLMTRAGYPGCPRSHTPRQR